MTTSYQGIINSMNPLLLALTLSTTAQDPGGWERIFDGFTLKGWTPKIKGYELGNNFGNTFRTRGNTIQVNYSAYSDGFKDRFGHLFYKTEYSNYIFRMEYRFFGEQCEGGPGWAYKNSGVMIHGQKPETMALNQDFPVSAEVQILGGDAEGVRHTGNLCTPGTNVVIANQLVTQHCIDSISDTLRGEVWVKLEIEVHGNKEVIHRINGKEVIRYSNVQYDPRDADAQKLIKGAELSISGGTISLQSESHPVEFRNIWIKRLAD